MNCDIERIIHIFEPLYKNIDQLDDESEPKTCFLTSSLYHSKKLGNNFSIKEVGHLFTNIQQNSIELCFDQLLEHCTTLVQENFQSYKNYIDLRTSLSYLISEYINKQDIRKIEETNVEKIATQIFDDQIIPLFVYSFQENVIWLSATEQEYFKKKGADIAFATVLQSAQEQVKNANSETYLNEIPLSKDGTYTLPIIKCLISFEQENVFIKRLENRDLQKLIGAYKDHIGRNIIHYASAKCKKEIVKKLCELYPDSINSGDGYQRTPLHIACRQGNGDVVSILLNAAKVNYHQESTLNAVDGFNRGAMHIAAIYDQSSIVEQLIDLGIQPAAKDNYGRTALHLASLFNNKEFITELVRHSCIEVTAKDNRGRTPLHLAAAKNSTDSIEILIQQHADQNAKDSQGNTPLHITTLYNHSEAASKLLELGADAKLLNKKNQNPLYLAIKQDSVESIKVFVAKHKTVNNIMFDDSADTMLHIAAKYGSTKTITYLVAEKLCDINCKNLHKSTPLHHSIFNGQLQSVLLLLGSKANIMEKDKDGRVPLQLVSKHNDDLYNLCYTETEYTVRKLQCIVPCIKDLLALRLSKNLYTNQNYFANINNNIHDYSQDRVILNFMKYLYAQLDEKISLNMENFDNFMQDILSKRYASLQNKEIALESKDNLFCISILDKLQKYDDAKKYYEELPEDYKPTNILDRLILFKYQHNLWEKPSSANLDISGSFIEPKDLRIIGDFFNNIQGINEIVLDSIGLDKNSIKSLKPVFQSHIVRLELAGNCLKNEGVKFLINSLYESNNTSLEHLDLWDNYITFEGAEYLEESIKDICIKTLILRNNFISQEGSKFLFAALSNNESITSLDLRDNCLSEACGNIANFIKKSNSITEIDISGNEIGSNVIESLCEALTTNKSLKKLIIKNNKITDLRNLLNALEQNTTLEELSMHGNEVSDEGALELFGFFDRGKRSVNIDMSANNIGDDGMKYLKNLLSPLLGAIDLTDNLGHIET